MSITFERKIRTSKLTFQICMSQSIISPFISRLFNNRVNGSTVNPQGLIEIKVKHERANVIDSYRRVHVEDSNCWTSSSFTSSFVGLVHHSHHHLNPLGITNKQWASKIIEI